MKLYILYAFLLVTTFADENTTSAENSTTPATVTEERPEFGDENLQSNFYLRTFYFN